MIDPGAQPLFSRVFRFLLSGAGNTVLSYGLYLALIGFLPYWLSYSLAFAFGVAYSYFMFRYFVFRAKGARHAYVRVVLIYAIQYLLGLALVRAWVELLAQPEWLAPVFATALSLPFTYYMSSRVFLRRLDASDESASEPNV